MNTVRYLLFGMGAIIGLALILRNPAGDVSIFNSLSGSANSFAKTVLTPY